MDFQHKSTFVQWTFNIKSTFFQWTFNIKSTFVQWTCNIKSTFVQWTCNIKSTFFQWTFNIKSTFAYMWTLPDHPGASRNWNPTPGLPPVRQNLPDVKIQKKIFFLFFFSRPSFLRICMVISVTYCLKVINSLAGLNIQAIDKSDTWHSNITLRRQLRASQMIRNESYYFLFIFYKCMSTF